MLRRLIGVAALLAVLVGTAACGGSPSGTASKPAAPQSAQKGAASSTPPATAKGGAPASSGTYTLNAIESESGQVSFLGLAETKVIKLYAKAQNAKGGWDGRQLKVNILDDQSNPRLDVQLMDQLIAQHVPVVFGPDLGALCSAVIPLVEKSGPLDYCLSPTINPPANSYVFSAIVAFPSAAKATLTYLRGRGLKRIALLTTTDVSGNAGEAAFKAAFALPQNSSLHLVADEKYNVTDVSVAAQLARIKAANPQVLIVFVTGTPLGTALKGIIQAGLSIPVVTDDGNMTYPEMKQWANIIPPGGLYFPSGAWAAVSSLPPGPQKDAGQAFYAAFKGTGIKPDIGYTLPWDALNLVAAAVKHYGPGATAAQIHQFLESQTHFVGMYGVYNFSLTAPQSRQRGLGNHNAYVYRWDPQKTTWVVVSGPGGVPLASQS